MANVLYSKDVTLGKNLWSLPSKIAELDSEIISLDFHLQQGLIYLLSDRLHVANITLLPDNGSVNISSIEEVDHHKMTLTPDDLVDSLSGTECL